MSHCEQCGNRKPNPNKFCSRRCYAQWRKANRRGHEYPAWKGGRKAINNDYIGVLTGKNQYTQEHILIAEKALGHALPQGAVVHHHDENGFNNQNQNLVICESRKYHALLHSRMRAITACGNPDWVRCYVCHQYDDPTKVQLYKCGRYWTQAHRICKTRQRAKQKALARIREFTDSQPATDEDVANWKDFNRGQG